jgi:hypothetical protein
MADTSKAVPTGKGGYDRIGVPNGAGAVKLMTKGDFENLPLADRVRLLMGGTLQFFRDGQQVTAREALRGA